MNFEDRIKKNFDLAFHNTFHLAGTAEFFIVVKNKQELLAAVNWAKAKKLPVSFFAGGSNILISGKKVKGLVIKIQGDNYSINKNFIKAWPGVNLTKLAKIAAENNLSGLEWAIGIPGSLGGALRGNAGAYGSEISRIVVEAEAYDLSKNKVIKLSNQACRFGYRHSIFKEKKNLIILNVKLKLAKGEAAEIKKIINKNFCHRLTTKPKEPSAGCVFKNLEYNKLIKQNKQLAKHLHDKGLVRGGKIGVGYLIDQLGLKGKSRGGAKISPEHANFIINTGKATPADIIFLIKLIKAKMKNKYKINLQEEIQYFGK